ncbi:MAG: hypothetical protein HC896_05375 [Bacteroidales bacterium]|nr:hypothetical protein [Bacteroidales bacterium]
MHTKNHYLSFTQVLILLIAIHIHVSAQDVTIAFPAAANVLDVTKSPYNADKTGNVDATLAIQAALNNALENQIVYLPDGTYLVSNTVTAPRKNRVQLQGQSKTGTIIRLKNNATGFGTKKSIFIIGEPNHGQSFFNEVRNLTFHAGNGNPGAVGVHYAANNQGSIRHINIVSGDGAGAVGLDLTAGTNGPCFVYDVQVTGFDIGIENASYHSVTLEKIVLNNQNTLGFLNNTTGNGCAIYNLASNNQVLVIDNQKTMSLVKANFTGGPGYGPAIKNSSSLYARNVIQSGYGLVVNNLDGHRQDASGTSLDEFVSHNVRFTTPSPTSSLQLPIKAIPDVPWGNPNSFDWGNVMDYVLPVEGSDITKAMQRAIDAGHKTVYIPSNPGGNNTVNLSGTVYVRNNCERIISCGAEFGYENVGRIEVVDGNPGSVIIERLRGAYTKIEYVHNTSRTVVFSSMPTGFGHVPFVSNGTGDLHIVDIPGQFHFNNANQNIWCRQVNPEGDFEGLVNRGANLWIHGIKTEGGETKIITSDGGKTELIGGQVFANVNLAKPSGSNDPLIMNVFEIDNASFSFAGIHRRLAWYDRHPYRNWVKETRGGITTFLSTDSAASDEPVALFNGSIEPSSALPVAPGGLAASLSLSNVNVTWNDNAVNEFGYEIQRSTSSAFNSNLLSYVIKDNQDEFIDKYTLPETTYYYRVRAFNGLGYTAWSNSVSITSPDLYI